jgi:hypothetical protein
MKSIIIIVPFLVVLICSGCENQFGLRQDVPLSIIGCWKDAGSVDTLLKFERVRLLNDDAYGFKFMSDEIFIERKNTGWCGTPPICYGDYEGTWTLDDSTLNINVGYWGGRVNYKWKIISIDRNFLTIDVVKSEYQFER